MSLCWVPIASLASFSKKKIYPERRRLPPDSFLALRWEHDQSRTAPSGPPRPQVRSARFPQLPRAPARHRGPYPPRRPPLLPTEISDVRAQRWMRLGVSGRAPAAGAQRGAACPRKGCGKASAPPRSRGWFRGSPPLSRPRRPFSSPITLLRRRGRFTARGGTRTAQRRARGSLWRYRRAPPSPAPSGRSPRLCPAHNGAAGWRGGGRGGRRGLGRAPRRRERSAAPG